MLNVGRKGSGKSLNIHFLVFLAHGFDEKLMALLVCKAHDLILNGRAVPRARAVDMSRIHSASVDIILDDFMRFGVGVNDMARGLYKAVKGIGGSEGRVGDYHILTRLFFKRIKVY